MHLLSLVLSVVQLALYAMVCTVYFIRYAVQYFPGGSKNIPYKEFYSQASCLITGIHTYRHTVTVEPWRSWTFVSQKFQILFLFFILLWYKLFATRNIFVLQISCKNESLSFAHVIRVSECDWHQRADWLNVPCFIYSINNGRVFHVH